MSTRKNQRKYNNFSRISTTFKKLRKRFIDYLEISEISHNFPYIFNYLIKIKKVYYNII